MHIKQKKLSNVFALTHFCKNNLHLMIVKGHHWCARVSASERERVCVCVEDVFFIRHFPHNFWGMDKKQIWLLIETSMIKWIQKRNFFVKSSFRPILVRLLSSDCFFRKIRLNKTEDRYIWTITWSRVSKDSLHKRYNIKAMTNILLKVLWSSI